jgi:hypothetical protein
VGRAWGKNKAVVHRDSRAARQYDRDCGQHPVQVERALSVHAMSTELAACASCGAVTALQTCAGCSVAAYCGKECQRKGWKGHRLECPLLITRNQQQRDVASHKAPPTGLGGYMDALADGRDALTGRQSFTTEKKESHHARGPYGIIDCGERGRGAAATEPLIPGMLILDEPAVASVPQKQYRDTVCHRCYQLLGKSPRQCKECSCSWWCSDSCQTEARPSHEIECAVLGQFDPKTRESLHGLRFFVQLATCTGNVAIPPKDFVSTKAPATLDGLVATISKVIPKELAVQRSTIQDSIVAVEASGFFITDLDGRRYVLSTLRPSHLGTTASPHRLRTQTQSISCLWCHTCSQLPHFLMCFAQVGERILPLGRTL